jgi:hypothetical protein
MFFSNKKRHPWLDAASLPMTYKLAIEKNMSEAASKQK